MTGPAHQQELPPEQVLAPASAPTSHPRVREVAALGEIVRERLSQVLSDYLRGSEAVHFHLGLPPGTVAAPWVRSRAKLTKFTVGVIDGETFTPLLLVDFRKSGLGVHIDVHQIAPDRSYAPGLLDGVRATLAALGDEQSISTTLIEKTTLDERLQALSLRIKSVNWQRPARGAILTSAAALAVFGAYHGVRGVAWLLDSDERASREFVRTLASRGSPEDIAQQMLVSYNREQAFRGLELLLTSDSAADRAAGRALVGRIAESVGSRLGGQDKVDVRDEIVSGLRKAGESAAGNRDPETALAIVKAHTALNQRFDAARAGIARGRFERIIRVIESEGGNESILAKELGRIRPEDLQYLLNAASSHSSGENRFVARFLDRGARVLISRGISFPGSSNSPGEVSQIESIAQALALCGDEASARAGSRFKGELATLRRTGEAAVAKRVSKQADESAVAKLEALADFLTVQGPRDPAGVRRQLRQENTAIANALQLLSKGDPKHQERSLAAVRKMDAALGALSSNPSIGAEVVATRNEVRQKVLPQLDALAKSPSRDGASVLAREIGDWFRKPVESPAGIPTAATKTSPLQSTEQLQAMFKSNPDQFLVKEVSAIFNTSPTSFNVSGVLSLGEAYERLDTLLVSIDARDQHKALDAIDRVVSVAESVKPMPNSGKITLGRLSSLLDSKRGAASLSVRARNRVNQLIERIAPL